MEKLLITLVSDGSALTLLETTHAAVCVEPNSCHPVPRTPSGPALLKSVSQCFVSRDLQVPVMEPVTARVHHRNMAMPAVHNPCDVSCIGCMDQFDNEVQEFPLPEMKSGPTNMPRGYQIRTLSFDSVDNTDDCVHSGCDRDEEDGLSLREWVFNEVESDDKQKKSEHPYVKARLGKRERPLSSSREPEVVPANREQRRTSAKPVKTRDAIETAGRQLKAVV